MKTIRYLAAAVLFLASATGIAQKVNVDTKTSTVNWIGEKIGGQHEGLISIKSGSLNLANDQIKSGEFTIDMNSITCTDLEDETYNQKLVGHLKSDDFFGVEKHPTAILTITNATKFTNGKATVTGKIKIKGKTETVKFDVYKKGNTYTAELKVDRSKFDVRYGSTSFFDSLGDKAIDDIFTLNIKLVTA